MFADKNGRPMRSSPRTGIGSWITAPFVRFSVAAAEVVDAAALMVDDLGGTQRITLGADKGYDRREFVQVLRDKNVTPMWPGSGRAPPSMAARPATGAMP